MSILSALSTSVFAGDRHIFASNIREADGLAFGSNGDLFVAAETWRGAVYRVSPEGKVSVFVKGIPSADGIVIAQDGTMYVTSETMNGRVAVVGSEGNVRTLAPLRNPEGMAFDPEGRLCIAEDIPRGRIVRVVAGRIETIAEGLDHPENIAFDPLGNLYVTETGTGRILRIDAARHKNLLTDKIESPDGILYSESFSGFFVTQDKPSQAHVYYVSLDGKITSILEGLYEPQGTIFDSDGNLYVAEQGKHRVIRISSEEIQESMANEDR